jgi:hypothetical protein
VRWRLRKNNLQHGTGVHTGRTAYACGAQKLACIGLSLHGLVTRRVRAMPSVSMRGGRHPSRIHDAGLDTADFLATSATIQPNNSIAARLAIRLKVVKWGGACSADSGTTT